jgi:hypothetical protein
MSTPIPECHCLACGHKLNAFNALNTAEPPKPGDLALCMRCGAVMKIDVDLTVRGLTRTEMDDLCNDPETMRYLEKQVAAIHFLPKLN